MHLERKKERFGGGLDPQRGLNLRNMLMHVTGVVADSDGSFGGLSLHHGTDMYRAVVACCRTLCPRDLVDDLSLIGIHQRSATPPASGGMASVPLGIDQSIPDLRSIRVLHSRVDMHHWPDTIVGPFIPFCGHSPPDPTRHSFDVIVVFVAVVPLEYRDTWIPAFGNPSRELEDYAVLPCVTGWTIICIPALLP